MSVYEFQLPPGVLAIVEDECCDEDWGETDWGEGDPFIPPDDGLGAARAMVYLGCAFLVSIPIWLLAGYGLYRLVWR